MLEGFERICPSRGIPAVAIAKYGLIFNKNVAKYFGERNRVLFLVNQEKKQIAIQKSDNHNEQSIPFFRKVAATRFTYRDFVQRVLDMKDFDLENHYYKAKGTISEEDKAIIFDIGEAMQKDRVFRHRRLDDESDD